MALERAGHIERLPSGSLRVSVLAGSDPLTGKQLWHRKTVRSEREAQIALGKLLELAEAERRPATRVTVGEAVAHRLAWAGSAWSASRFSSSASVTGAAWDLAQSVTSAARWRAGATRAC